MKRSPVELAGQTITPGSRATVLLPVPETYLRQGDSMPVHVIHGRRSGPSMVVCAAVHGDELNGVEIIRRLTQLKRISSLAGTLYAVPVVNLYGFLSNSRYLPDRRDLNRFFPGTSTGSLASSLAQVFFQNVICRCEYGIDFHTGSNHRRNIPHLRGDMSDPVILAMAQSFGAPISIHGLGSEGSLRRSAGEKGLKMLTFEGGEALRFDEFSIRAGVRGILSVMEHLGMLTAKRKSRRSAGTMQVAQNSSWVRAGASGLFQSRIKLGQLVQKGQPLGSIVDPITSEVFSVEAPKQGVVIGIQSLPSVYKGDALLHVGYFDAPAKAQALVDAFSEQLDDSERSA